MTGLPLPPPQGPAVAGGLPERAATAQGEPAAARPDPEEAVARADTGGRVDAALAGRPDRYLTALPHEDGRGLPPKPSRTR